MNACVNWKATWICRSHPSASRVRERKNTDSSIRSLGIWILRFNLCYHSKTWDHCIMFGCRYVWNACSCWLGEQLGFNLSGKSVSSLKLRASTSLCRKLLILNQNRTWFFALNCLELKEKKKKQTSANLKGLKERLKCAWTSVLELNFFRLLVKNVITLCFEKSQQKTFLYYS